MGLFSWAFLCEFLSEARCCKDLRWELRDLRRDGLWRTSNIDPVGSGSVSGEPSLLNGFKIFRHELREDGSNLKMNPTIREEKPKARQTRFWFVVRGAHLTALPPYSTKIIWTITVTIKTKRNKKLLKNPAKTFHSHGFSFRALISLNTCKYTKMLKNIVKCTPFSSFHYLTRIPRSTPNQLGP